MHARGCVDSSIEESKNRYKILKNKGKNVVSKAMRENAEEGLTELRSCTNGMF